VQGNGQEIENNATGIFFTAPVDAVNMFSKIIIWK
jgi:hypothetical protein